MNKKYLKQLVSKLKYKEVFEVLDSLNIDSNDLKELNNKMQSLRDSRISKKIQYTHKEWEMQFNRNLVIAKGLLKHINSI
jgi:hypothetical protein